MTRRRVVVIGSSAAAAIAAAVVAVVLIVPSNGTPVRLTVGDSADVSATPTPSVDETPSPEVSEPDPSAEPSSTPEPTGADPTDPPTVKPKASRPPFNNCPYDPCWDGKPGWYAGDTGCSTHLTRTPPGKPPSSDLSLSLVMDSATLVTATEVGGTVTMRNDGVEDVSFRYFEWERNTNESAGLVDAAGDTVTAYHLWYGGPAGGDGLTAHEIRLEPGQSESFRVEFTVVNCGDTSYEEEPPVPPGSYRAVASLAWRSWNSSSDQQNGTWVSDPVPVTVT